MFKSVALLYEADVLEQISYFVEENQNRDGASDRALTYYENLMHMDNFVSESEIKAAKECHIKRKEDIINAAIVKCYQLRDSTISKMQTLHQQLNKVFHDLAADTINVRPKEEMKLAYAKQKQYDQELQRAKIAAKQGIDTIAQLQQKLTTTMLECQKREFRAMEHRNSKHINLLHLKGKIKRNTEIYQSQLQALTTESFYVIKDLKKIVDYGTHLIGLALVCRKYQTEKEKVSPWPAKSNEVAQKYQQTPDLEFAASSSKALNYNDNYTALDQAEKMQNFTYRSACCEAQCRVLRSEKEELQEQNRKYIDLIKNCYEAIAYQKIKKHIRASDLLCTINIEQKTAIPKI